MLLQRFAKLRDRGACFSGRRVHLRAARKFAFEIEKAIRGNRQRIFKIVIPSASDRAHEVQCCVVAYIRRLLNFRYAFGDEFFFEFRDLAVTRGALAKRSLVRAEELREKGADAAADIDEERRLLRRVESAALNAGSDGFAIRGETREQIGVAAGDVAIERRRQIAKATDVAKIRVDERLDAEIHGFSNSRSGVFLRM